MKWEEVFKSILADPTVKSLEVTEWKSYEDAGGNLHDVKPIFKVEKFERLNEE